MGFPKQPIELNLSNYNQYIPLNIIAFSFASGGAQGEPGGVIIINDEGQIFHFNYVEGDIKQPKVVYLVCPPIKEKLTGIVQSQGEWNEITLNIILKHKKNLVFFFLIIIIILRNLFHDKRIKIIWEWEIA